MSPPARPGSPPLHEECPMIVSEPLSAKIKHHQSNFLEGFRNTLRRAKSEAPEIDSSVGHIRRWSDAHPSALVSVAEGAPGLECCDHETGRWAPVGSTAVALAGGRLVPGLSEGHTYSFRLAGHGALASFTVPHETRWQQEQFERRYEELHVIGKGRTGTVRLARDRGTGQRVAVKQVDRRRIPQVVTRAEYGYLTTLNHSNVVKGLAMFENAPALGHDSIVMEFVGGQDVLSHASRLDTVSEAHIRLVCRQLLSALHHLRLHHIAHCDIKPDNLLIESHNNQYQLKIVDFGSANSLDPGIEVQPCKLNLSLDLEFAAPEQLAETATCSFTTDVWSCGVLIYIFLSGVSPFLDDSPEETISHVLSADFSFPPELFPSQSTAAQLFVSSLLVQNPTARPLAHSALSLPWLKLVSSDFNVSPTLLASFINRRNPNSLQRFVD